MRDELYIQRCFELARLGTGKVSPNPMVGAVLVYEGKIIGEGWHKAFGQAHAEVNCFESVRAEDRKLVPQSTLYCSLEPCSHFGKTPPCVDLILAQKAPRVVVANTDPNPLVAGKGLAKLREAGVEVIYGVLAEEGAWLNRVFFTWISKKRPYIILKWARSVDGFLGRKGERTPVSNPLAQRMVHRWRAESDAILVGAVTAKIDDPQLDVRHYFGKNPMRVLLDGKGTTPIERHLLSDEKPTLVFGPYRPGLSIQKTFVPCENQAPMTNVIEILAQKNLASLLVEGGATVLQQFIQQGLWDEIRIIVSPHPLKDGIEAPQVPAGAVLREQYLLGTDMVYLYTPTLQLRH